MGIKDDLKDFDKVWNEKCKYKQLPSSLPKVDKIIAIGDIHGDYQLMIDLLKLGEVIDDNDNWIGGQTIVVQVGDQIDRCRMDMYNNIKCDNPSATVNDENSDIKILKYFTDLHEKAEKVGGAVYSLIGNHELMNVKGDMNYVSAKNLLDFDPNFKDVNKGKENRKKYFKPGSKYANFLACTRQSILIIGNNLFVHAGIVKEFAEKYPNISDINKIVSLYLLGKLENANEYYDILENPKVCPFWTRYIGMHSKDYSKFEVNKNFCDYLTKTLKIYNVNNMIVGHTAQVNSGINNACENKINFVDTGTSQAFDKIRQFKKKKQVLKITNDNIYKILTLNY